ncbi:MAG: preprotein translocase subunit SecG [bacterium]|nr:preprotein translocase subunit SecG [bacterium]
MGSILYIALVVIHIFVCFGVILIVLLQSGKGAGLSSAFGVGSGESFFGGRGPMLFLEKLTTGCAIVFMFTCLSLSLLASKQRTSSVVDNIPVQQAPAVPAQPAPVNVPPATPTQTPSVPVTPTPTK